MAGGERRLEVTHSQVAPPVENLPYRILSCVVYINNLINSGIIIECSVDTIETREDYSPVVVDSISVDISAIASISVVRL